MKRDSIILLGKLAEALQIEKQYEIQEHQLILKESSISERKAEGMTWYPVTLVDRKYSLSSIPLVKLKRNPSDETAHSFQNGTPVSVFSTENDERVNGMVYRLEEGEMWISLHGEDAPEWIDEKGIGINVAFDSKTFLEMEKALNFVINEERGTTADLREILYGNKSSVREEIHPIEIPNLNESQNLALNDILSSKDISIIHGPPGTGKTTTLVESIHQLAKKESSILVCAPSNAAVDHLVRKLHEKGLEVTRIGNLAKIDESLVPLTLNGKIEAQPDYKQISQYKRQAIELREKALKYKRSFGPEEREKRKSYFRESKELLRESKELEKYLIDKILEKSEVVCTTLIGSSHFYLQDKTFKTVFIDEAAQGLEPACWVPILKSEKVVLAGDPYQLPPTVKSMDAEKAGLNETLIEKAMAFGHQSILLNTQYRMNSKIMEYSNQWFYNNELIAHESVKDWTLKNAPNPIEFIDTAGCGFDEKTDEGQYSKSNPGEVDIVNKRIKEFENLDEMSIAIISPYKEQIQSLQKEYKDKGNIAVNTIDSFQGQEKDVIIISLVRSNANGEIGFLKDYRRMNVAMTRARKKLIIIGDSATIGQDKFYDGFLNYCESNGFYKSAWDYLY